MARGWGNRVGYTVVRGASAEYCQDCDAVRVFAVEDWMVHHTFIIWKLYEAREDRRRVCWKCGWWFRLTGGGFHARFSTWVSVHEAERLPLREIAFQTNPALYDEFYD